MSLATQTQNKIVAFEFSDDKVQLLKNTVCKGATDDELQLFLHVCSRTGLDPFRNQIYAIKRNGKDGARMTIQTGIDGFRLIAERTEGYAPGREPSYGYDSQGKITSATSYIKKRTKDGTWHEVSATAFWREYVQEYNGKPSQFWAKMPHGQLAKCAEALALRKAFPADFSGLYTTEEMAQADNDTINIQAEKVSEKIAEPVKEIPLTPQEVDDYVTANWKDDFDQFHQFMHEIVMAKAWSYRKCIDTFNADMKRTKANFEKWKKK